MFKKIFLGFLVVLVVVAGGLAIAIAFQPDDMRIERSGTIAAAPAEVFPLVNDLRKWEEWSPWAELDPNTNYKYEGPTEGKGASVQWSGNSNVGKGKMTILESQPNELIRIKLEFMEPMEDTSTTEFTFKSDGTQTVVNWSMFGKHTIMSKGMCLFVDMDKMIGNDFEKGLASMKAIAEKSAKN